MSRSTSPSLRIAFAIFMQYDANKSALLRGLSDGAFARVACQWQGFVSVNNEDILIWIQRGHWQLTRTLTQTIICKTTKPSDSALFGFTDIALNMLLHFLAVNSTDQLLPSLLHFSLNLDLAIPLYFIACASNRLHPWRRRRRGKPKAWTAMMFSKYSS